MSHTEAQRTQRLGSRGWGVMGVSWGWKNPCRGFVLKNDNMTLQKEILLPEEIQHLVATHFEGERPEIHRAFIFGLYTGVRWCDTSQLTYRNVDYSTQTLRFQQQKKKTTAAGAG